MRRFGWILLVLLTVTARAQLPQARLTAIFPPGATSGTTTEVTVNGADLDDLKELRFSDPGITAVHDGGNRFKVAVATNVIPRIYEARVIGRFGGSNPRGFAVDPGTQVLDAATNQLSSSAQEITLGAIVNGRASANAADFFKVKLPAKQWVTFACEAQRLDSRMQPVLFLFDSTGKELARARTDGVLKFQAPAEGDYVLKLHDVQFRGGEEYWYRLAGRVGEKPLGHPATLLATATLGLLPLGDEPGESDNNDSPEKATMLMPPCEIRGQFYPQRDVDWFQFDGKAGKAFWIEAISHRLGLGTDPLLVIQRVTKNDKGEEKVEETQEIYDFETNPGGAEFNMTTRDPMHRFETKDGLYRIQVRDLFNQNNSDSRRTYHLRVKEDSPAFALVAAPVAPPPLNRDQKEALPWGLFLRRGDMIPIRVLAYRLCGFNGEIELRVEGLPTGVSAAPASLKPGATTTTLMLQSTDDVAAWSGPIRVIGKAKIGDTEVLRPARAATIRWPVPDYNNEMVQSHLAHELVLAVSGAEPAPVSIRPTNVVDAVAGSKVSIPLVIARRGEFHNPIKFRVFTEPVKEFEVDGKATNAVFELDLNQTKLGPGQHWFAIHATSPGRYRRITPDEAKAFDDEIKKLRESLPGLTEQPKKDAANNRIKEVEGRLAYRDLTATFYSTFGVNVTAAAAAKAP